MAPLSSKQPSASAQPVFLINLDRRVDRYAEADALLSHLGISYERISAFDAKAAPSLPHVDWWRAFVYNNFNPPALGQVGCYLSHRMIWQKMVDENIPQAVIFEDDVVEDHFHPTFVNLDISALGLDLLRLEGFPANYNPSIFQKASRSPMPIKDRKISFAPSYGTACYVITLAGAKKCLSLESHWFSIDHFDMWEHLTGLQTGVLQPPLFKQKPSTSDVVGTRIGMDVISEAKAERYPPANTTQRIVDFLVLKMRIASVLPWQLRQSLKRRLLIMEMRC